MIKTAAIALVCGFMGAALYGRLFPPPSPYDYIAIAKYTGSQGQDLTPAQMELVQRRAENMAQAGYIIFNDSSMYRYPPALLVPQTIGGSAK